MTATATGRRGARVPVLMYHLVSDLPIGGFRRFTVTPRAFAAQVGWLAAAGYVSVGLDALARHRAEGAPLPRRAVVVTFDDGYEEAIDHAVPVLRAHGFTATFFLVTGSVGGGSSWLRETRGFELPVIGWGVARDLADAGFSIGSHTVTHRRLAELSDAECRDELGASRALLEDRLGHPVAHLAYPYGSYDERVRRIAAESGYRVACSTRAGRSGPDDDLLALHRVEVSGLDSWADYRFRVWTARTPGEALRRAARALRRRVAAPRGAGEGAR